MKESGLVYLPLSKAGERQLMLYILSLEQEHISTREIFLSGISTLWATAYNFDEVIASSSLI